MNDNSGYPPKHHVHNEQSDLWNIVEKIGFGAIVTNNEEYPFITHLPFVINKINGTYCLDTHIDRRNPHTDRLNDSNVSVAFSGPNSYISPTVYTTPQLPTWNYINIIVQGRCQLIVDDAAKTEHLIQLIKHYEGLNKTSYSINRNAPRLVNLLPEITGLRIFTSQIIGRFKLSQDKIQTDFMNAAETLKSRFSEKSASIIEDVYGLTTSRGQP